MVLSGLDSGFIREYVVWLVVALSAFVGVRGARFFYPAAKSIKNPCEGS